jgi:hypothetical protein
MELNHLISSMYKNGTLPTVLINTVIMIGAGIVGVGIGAIYNFVHALVVNRQRAANNIFDIPALSSALNIISGPPNPNHDSISITMEKIHGLKHKLLAEVSEVEGQKMVQAKVSLDKFIQAKHDYLQVQEADAATATSKTAAMQALLKLMPIAPTPQDTLAEVIETAESLLRQQAFAALAQCAQKLFFYAKQIIKPNYYEYYRDGPHLIFHPQELSSLVESTENLINNFIDRFLKDINWQRHLDEGAPVRFLPINDDEKDREWITAAMEGLALSYEACLQAGNQVVAGTLSYQKYIKLTFEMYTHALTCTHLLAQLSKNK